MENKDFEIIDEIIKGNKKKYEVLIRKYNQRLYRFAKGILWEEEAIEDVMQDTYIKAYQQLSKFEQRSNFSTWITRILINECLMIKRKKKISSPIDFEYEQTIKSPFLTNDKTPEKEVINKELKIFLENAIQRLPEKYRTVFVMRELENLNVYETSESLRITETNVKARLSRAKEMLRENLTNSVPLNELLDFNLTRCHRIVENVLKQI